MGGNAIPKDLFMTTRKTAAEYFALKDRVEMECAFIEGVNDYEVVKAYRDKESYGDMDVVLRLEKDCDLNALRKDICDQFGVRAMFTNGNPRNIYLDHGPVSLDSVYSICFSDFQIDFILTPNEEEFIAALNYFAWNDLGNLLGRVVHKFGFKLGHKGLMYPFKDGDYQFEEMLVTIDWSIILPAFDYCYQTFVKGFDTKEEIFEFVASSKYFRPDIYLFENRNAKARYRDKKRQTYMEFLDWCEKNRDRWPTQEMSLGEAQMRMADSHTEIRNALKIVDFNDRFHEAWVRFRRWQTIRTKFNGDLVREWTGLEHKELGAFIQWFKSRWVGLDEFQNYVMNTPSEKIASDVEQAKRNLWKYKES